MKHKTAELEGALLDAAVAKAEGIQHDASGLPRAVFVHQGSDSMIYAPSTDWRHGGPIIERERIELADGGEAHGARVWWAALFTDRTNGRTGPTALVAAMRAYVASKLGEEVELP